MNIPVSDPGFTSIHQVRHMEDPPSQPLRISEVSAEPPISERTQVVARPVFDKIAVFGDSLSDPGNAFSLWHQETVPPYDTLDALSVPTYPYANGAHHYCNGPTWIELFAKTRGLDVNSLPAFLEPIRDHMNFAVGRARARSTSDTDLVNLSAQVDEFFRRTEGTDSSNTLHVLEIGANDVRDALVALPEEEENASSKILNQALEEIDTSVRKLYARGARKFLVWNIPDIGKTPALRFLDSQHPGIARSVGDLTGAFNTGLKTHIRALSELQGITVHELDVHQKVDHMIAHPEEYGLREVTSSYVKPHVLTSETQNPDEYLFWDGIHPSEVFHRVIAQEAALIMSH